MTLREKKKKSHIKSLIKNTLEEGMIPNLTPYAMTVNSKSRNKNFIVLFL